MKLRLMRAGRHEPRILVFIRGHLGDVVTALPALRDLRKAYPTGQISVVCSEYVRGALEGCPYVDEVIYGFAYRPQSAARSALLRLRLAALTAGRFDIALFLRNSPRSSPVLGLTSGARIRVGYRQSGWAGHLLTENLSAEPRVQSNRITNSAVVRRLGVPASPALPRLDWVSGADRKRADQLLADHGIEAETRFAVFQVAAHWGCYEWRSDKWAALADHLAKRHGTKVIVAGTAENFELRKFAEISALSPVAASIQGLTTLPMLFHVISRASLVVAADSALTQIALAQEVPSVILFGIEPQVRNGPLPEETGSLMEAIQHWEGVEHSPPPNPHCLFGQSHCHTRNCRENSSFQQITAEEVCARADRILDPANTAGLSAVH